MQYFGDSRSNPNDAHDLTSAAKLLAHEAQSVQRDFVDAEMVKAFVTSGENFSASDLEKQTVSLLQITQVWRRAQSLVFPSAPR